MLLVVGNATGIFLAPSPLIKMNAAPCPPVVTAQHHPGTDCGRGTTTSTTRPGLFVPASVAARRLLLQAVWSQPQLRAAAPQCRPLGVPAHGDRYGDAGVCSLTPRSALFQVVDCLYALGGVVSEMTSISVAENEGETRKLNASRDAMLKWQWRATPPVHL